MSDEFNNQNPENQPGWASGSDNNPPINPQQGQPQNPYSQQPGYPQAQPYGGQPGYPQPSPYGQQPGYPQAQPQKKKSKLWLWITLAVVIPLLLCGLGIGGCAFFAASNLTPPIDATNDFYKAAKAGDDLDPYTCQRYLNQDSSFNEVFDSEPQIDSYNFSSVDIVNGQATVTGTVTRAGEVRDAEIELEKDDGKYKVCFVRETPQ